ncbi:MAG: hypothetical protein NT068_03980 [Candidatus Nomurabacteria bacterium]|nr:hypothetical protein [Candidatus Nomurabacteria bacterium]
MTQDLKKILKISSLSLLFLIIIIFAFFRSKDLVFGVKIKNVNIVDGSKMTGSILPIIGNAKNAVEVTIDGREISVDQNGNFNETIALLPGYNIIDIKAVDKFGHKDEKIYKLIY